MRRIAFSTFAIAMLTSTFVLADNPCGLEQNASESIFPGESWDNGDVRVQLISIYSTSGGWKTRLRSNISKFDGTWEHSGPLTVRSRLSKNGETCGEVTLSCRVESMVGGRGLKCTMGFF